MVTFLSTRTSWNMLSVLCVSTLTVWGGFATEADGVIPSDQNRRMLLKTYWKNFLNALLPYIVRNVSISWVAWPCVFQRQFLFFCVVCGPQCCCICTLRGQIACLDCKYRAVTNVSFYKSIRCFCWSRGLDSLCRFIGMSCCFFFPFSKWNSACLLVVLQTPKWRLAQVQCHHFAYFASRVYCTARVPGNDIRLCLLRNAVANLVHESQVAFLWLPA